MANNQHECGGAIVDDRGGIGPTEKSERSLNVISTLTAAAGGKIELYIIISGSDLAQRFTGSKWERRPTKVSVNDNSRSVNHRLDPRSSQFLDRFVKKSDNGIEFRDLASPA
jgi:hypothetical protein